MQTFTLTLSPESLRQIAGMLGGPDAAELLALADRLDAEGRVTVERPAYAVTYVDPGRDHPTAEAAPAPGFPAGSWPEQLRRYEASRPY